MVQRITVGEPNVRTVYENEENEIVDPDEYDGEVEETERENYPQFADCSDALMKEVQERQANADELKHPLEILGQIFLEENPEAEGELVYYYQEEQED